MSDSTETIRGLLTERSHQQKKKKPGPKTRAKGSDLIPNFARPGEGIAVRRWFWVGTLPSISHGEVTIAGVSFPRTHEIVKDREGSAPSARIPYIGQLMALSAAQVTAIIERLPHSVYRFIEAPREILTSGEGIEALEQTPRKGHPIRIMTDEEIKLRTENNLSTTLYEPQEWDEPLADHVFAVPCADQDRPRVGVEYPPPLSKTGLEWPGDVKD